MARLGINTGTAANDGTGDNLRTGAGKINNNFIELYSALGTGTNLQVGYGKTVIGLSSTTGYVGIGTTNPTSKLTVTGDASISGVTTSNAYLIGATQVVSSARQLQNIASLDSTTTATIESAIANAPNTFTNLQITGVSTFTNGPVLIGTGTSTGTATQRLQVTGGAYVSGNLGIGTTNPQGILQVGDSSTQSFIVTGIGSVGVGTTNPTTSLDVVGNLRVTGVIINSSNIAFTVAFGS